MADMATSSTVAAADAADCALETKMALILAMASEERRERALAIMRGVALVPEDEKVAEFVLRELQSGVRCRPGSEADAELQRLLCEAGFAADIERSAVLAELEAVAELEGICVRLRDIGARPELNGRAGIIVGVYSDDQGRGRCRVKLEDGEVISVVRAKLVRTKFCANCQIALGDEHRRKSGEFNECGACKEQRCPDPALYCGAKCAKEHWAAEHKAWHAENKATVMAVAENTPSAKREANVAQMAQDLKSDDEYVRLCGQAHEAAKQRRDFRTAEKLAKKAIAMRPGDPHAHTVLGGVYNQTGKANLAVDQYLKAREFSDVGTPCYACAGDRYWATSTAYAWANLKHPSYKGSKPEWCTDPALLKLNADRVIAALPKHMVALQMHVQAILSQKETPTLGEMWQALREQQTLVQLAEETGGEGYATHKAKATGIQYLLDDHPELAVPPTGRRVQLVGLEARPEFNGMRGTCGDYNETKGRFPVALESGESLMIKRVNLQVVGDADEEREEAQQAPPPQQQAPPPPQQAPPAAEARGGRGGRGGRGRGRGRARGAA